MELLEEIRDLIEEIEKGAEIGVSMGMIGHDISPELQAVMMDAVRAYADKLEGDINNG